MIVGQLTTCTMCCPEFEICARNQGLGQVVKDFSLTTTVTPKPTMLALDSEEEEWSVSELSVRTVKNYHDFVCFYPVIQPRISINMAYSGLPTHGQQPCKQSLFLSRDTSRLDHWGRISTISEVGNRKCRSVWANWGIIVWCSRCNIEYTLRLL